MSTKLSTWDDVTSLYRKKPARFKAVQFNKDEAITTSLPPDTYCMSCPDGSLALVATLTGNQSAVMNDGDWLVRDLLTDATFVLRDDVFHVLFESD
jgi:hypothetical protein